MSILDRILDSCWNKGRNPVVNGKSQLYTDDEKHQVKDLMIKLFEESEGVEHTFRQKVEKL